MASDGVHRLLVSTLLLSFIVLCFMDSNCVHSAATTSRKPAVQITSKHPPTRRITTTVTRRPLPPTTPAITPRAPLSTTKSTLSTSTRKPTTARTTATTTLKAVRWATSPTTRPTVARATSTTPPPRKPRDVTTGKRGTAAVSTTTKRTMRQTQAAGRLTTSSTKLLTRQREQITVARLASTPRVQKVPTTTRHVVRPTVRPTTRKPGRYHSGTAAIKSTQDQAVLWLAASAVIMVTMRQSSL